MKGILIIISPILLVLAYCGYSVLTDKSLKKKDENINFSDEDIW